MSLFVSCQSLPITSTLDTNLSLKRYFIYLVHWHAISDVNIKYLYFDLRRTDRRNQNETLDKPCNQFGRKLPGEGQDQELFEKNYITKCSVLKPWFQLSALLSNLVLVLGDNVSCMFETGQIIKVE